ncbi:MAG: hypothetical protein U9O78_03730 [Patescibacteria group bacterium]|nr:hypothetical protein [Patescibacteria group bacterium]
MFNVKTEDIPHLEEAVRAAIREKHAMAAQIEIEEFDGVEIKASKKRAKLYHLEFGISQAHRRLTHLQISGQGDKTSFLQSK